MDRKNIERRFQSMENEASGWRGQWQDLSRYIAPTRGFFSDAPNWGKAIDYKTVLDGSPSKAANILASGMTSGMTSPSRKWFLPTLSDKDLLEFDPVKLWLERLADLMYAIYSRSGIYGSLTNAYWEMGVFGPAALMIKENFDTVIHGDNFTIGEYYLGIDRTGKVNSFARAFYMTVGQIVEEFGKENASERVRGQYSEGKLDEYVKVKMLIEPNDERIPDMPGAKGMPFRCAYWEDLSPSDTFLRVGGFHEFPILAPRWSRVTTSEVYGHGPGWDAIGDVRELMKLTKDHGVALNKVIEPPLQTNSDAVIRTLPGQITRHSGQVVNAGVSPLYQINPDLGAIQNKINLKKQDINRAFYADLFLMMTESDRREVTAREIVERHEEKLLVLGPVLESIIWELLNPLHDRTFGIIMRAGLMPPPPQELQGQHIQIEYVSALAQAQKMVGTVAIEQSMGFLGNIIAAFPDTADVIDADEAVRQYFTLNGVSAKIIRSSQTVNAVRAEKIKAMQQAKAQENAAALVQGAKVLSETKIGQNSALDAVLQGVTGGLPTGQTLNNIV